MRVRLRLLFGICMILLRVAPAGARFAAGWEVAWMV